MGRHCIWKECCISQHLEITSSLPFSTYKFHFVCEISYSSLYLYYYINVLLITFAQGRKLCGKQFSKSKSVWSKNLYKVRVIFLFLVSSHFFPSFYFLLLRDSSGIKACLLLSPNSCWFHSHSYVITISISGNLIFRRKKNVIFLILRIILLGSDAFFGCK